MGSEEFLNRMVEIFGITIDRRPKVRPRKMENYTIEKIVCVPCILKQGFSNTMKMTVSLPGFY